MPQVSLYIDEETHREIETRARLSKISVSKLVASILKTHFSKNWPSGYQYTFGSIRDESFVRQAVPGWSLDVSRESI